VIGKLVQVKKYEEREKRLIIRGLTVVDYWTSLSGGRKSLENMLIEVIPSERAPRC
jgi:hypothetical protein